MFIRSSVQECVRRMGFLSISMMLLTSCATTHRGKVLESMALGAALGGAYGASRPEYQSQNALMFGSIAAALGSIYAEISDDIDLENQKKLEAMKELEKSLGQSPSINSNMEQLNFSASSMSSSQTLPSRLKGVLQQGRIRGFKTDDWIDWGSNRAAHIDEIWELDPAKFKIVK